MKKKILVVEDSTSLRRILTDVLASEGYEVHTAEDGNAGFELLQKTNFPVVITDLVMPNMDGNELIDKMKTLKEVPVIVVLTSNNDSSMIIEIMRKGVFDYLIKPVKKDSLFICLDRAYKFSELKRLKKITEGEKVIRLERQLEWYKYLERLGHKQNSLSDDKLFENLQRSINQGSGLGTLITLVDLLTGTAKKTGTGYEIDQKIFDQIVENQKLVYEAVRVFSEIENVSINSLDLEPITMMRLYEIFVELINELAPLTALRRHEIVLCDSKSYFDKLSVGINRGYFQMAMREILINAMKFSEPKSVIYMIIEKDGDGAAISVINSASTDVDSGIPMEYENIVFEPFFRKLKFVHDEYKTLDYGLGLTLVEKIIQKHNGKIALYNVHDYTDIMKNPMTKVNCKITMPAAAKNHAQAETGSGKEAFVSAAQ